MYDGLVLLRHHLICRWRRTKLATKQAITAENFFSICVCSAHHVRQRRNSLLDEYCSYDAEGSYGKVFSMPFAQERRFAYTCESERDGRTLVRQNDNVAAVTLPSTEGKQECQLRLFKHVLSLVYHYSVTLVRQCIFQTAYAGKTAYILTQSKLKHFRQQVHISSLLIKRLDMLKFANGKLHKLSVSIFTHI